MTKALRQVTDRFDLTNEGRIDGNKRNYLIRAVQTMLESSRTAEGIKLGELYGYYGHVRRCKAGKPVIGETEVIMVEGKPVVVDNVPANRTASIECSDEGIVTHTQDILKTPTGEMVDAMIESQAGGWSWVTTGTDRPAQSIARAFHGMDYVLKPNFISLDHEAMQMESSDQEQMLMESLQMKMNMSEGEAAAALNRLSGMDRALAMTSQQEEEIMFLESLLNERDALLTGEISELKDELHELKQGHESSIVLLTEAAQACPFNLTDAQLTALTQMKTEHDRDVVKAMFESFGRHNLSDLPLGEQDDNNVAEQEQSTMMESQEVKKYLVRRKTNPFA